MRFRSQQCPGSILAFSNLKIVQNLIIIIDSMILFTFTCCLGVNVILSDEVSGSDEFYVLNYANLFRL